MAGCTAEKTFYDKFITIYFCDKCNAHGLKVEESVKRRFYIYPFIH